MTQSPLSDIFSTSSRLRPSSLFRFMGEDTGKNQTGSDTRPERKFGGGGGAFGGVGASGHVPFERSTLGELGTGVAGGLVKTARNFVTTAPEILRNAEQSLLGPIAPLARGAQGIGESIGKRVASSAGFSDESIAQADQLSDPDFLSGKLGASLDAALASDFLRASDAAVAGTEGGKIPIGNWRWWVRAAGETAGQLGAQVAAGLATGPAGFLSVAGIDTFGSTFRESFDEMKSAGMDEGLAREIATLEAMAGAAITVITSRFELDAFLGKNPGAATLLSSGVRAWLGQKAKQGAIAGGAEALQEVTETLGQNFNKAVREFTTGGDVTAFDDIVSEVIVGGVLGFSAGAAIRSVLPTGGETTDQLKENLRLLNELQGQQEAKARAEDDARLSKAVEDVDRPPPPFTPEPRAPETLTPSQLQQRRARPVTSPGALTSLIESLPQSVTPSQVASIVHGQLEAVPVETLRDMAESRGIDPIPVRKTELIQEIVRHDQETTNEQPQGNIDTDPPATGQGQPVAQPDTVEAAPGAPDVGVQQSPDGEGSVELAAAPGSTESRDIRGVDTQQKQGAINEQVQTQGQAKTQAQTQALPQSAPEQLRGVEPAGGGGRRGQVPSQRGTGLSVDGPGSGQARVNLPQRRLTAGVPNPTSQIVEPLEADAGLPNPTPMRMDAPRGNKAVTNAPKVIKSFEGVARAFGGKAPIRTGRIGGRRARATFVVGPEVIRIRQANDIPAASHELGHAIDKMVNIEGRTPPNAVSELVSLGQSLYGAKPPANGYASEGIAEFTRLWLTQPKKAKQVAPNFFAFFESQVAGGPNSNTRKALLAARSETLAWQEQGALERSRQSVADTSGPTAKAKRLAAGVVNLDPKTKFIDSSAPLARMAREAEGLSGRKLAPTEDPAMLVSALSSTHAARARTMVEDGMIDIAGNTVGPPLNDIVSLVRGKQSDFTIYLYARRTLALAMDPEGPRNSGMTVQDARKVIGELESTEFELAAQKVYDWNEGVLNYAAQASPSFAKVVDSIRDRDPGSYIPLQREFDAFDQAARKGGGTGSITKRLRGSGRRIKDPFESMISNAQDTILAAHRRMVLDQILKLARVEGMGHLIEEVPVDRVPAASRKIGDLIKDIERKLGASSELIGEDIDSASDILQETITFYAPAHNPKSSENPILPVYDGNKVRWFEVDADIYATLSGLDVFRLPKMLDMFFGAPKRALTLGTTGMRASFGLVTNPIRDVVTFYFNTRAHQNGARVFSAWLTAMKNGLSVAVGGDPDPYTAAFLRGGAQMSQHLNQDSSQVRRASRRLFQGKTLTVIDPRNWLDLYRDVVNFPESAARVAELKLVAEQVGWKPGQPMTMDQSLKLLMATKQVTTDFTAGGTWAKAMNQAVPFFNASIQGPRASLRALKRNPSRFIAKGMMLAYATLLLWWKNKDEEWWEQMPWREKSLYWHVPIGEDIILRIPRPFEVGQTFAALPEAAMDAWNQDDPKAVKEWFNTFLDTTAPPTTPVLVRAAAQQLANRDFFWDSPIVPKRFEDLEKVRPEETFTDFTSRAAIFLGDVFKVSPLRIDQAMRDVGGGLPKDVLTLVGLGPRGTGADKEAADTALIGRLFLRGGQKAARSRFVDEMYDLMDEAVGLQRSRFQEETPADRKMRLMLSDATRSVSNLLFVRTQAKTVEERNRVAKEANDIARLAVEAVNKGEIDRKIFRAKRRDSRARRRAVTD